MGNESQGQFCTLSNLFEKYPEHSSPRSFGGMPPVNLRWTSRVERGENELTRPGGFRAPDSRHYFRDRKSTRLNSSHANISYAVFCLKKKKKKKNNRNNNITSKYQ